MNKAVERAREINNYADWNCKIPELEVGETCTIADVWDGKGEQPEREYCYKITDTGEDGNGNIDIWISYVWEILQQNKENFLETKIKITEIELI